MPKGTSLAEVMSNREKIKPAALASIAFNGLKASGRWMDRRISWWAGWLVGSQ